MKRTTGKAAAGAEPVQKKKVTRKPARRAQRKGAGTLTVELVHSGIACTGRQRGVLRSLGLRGIRDRHQLPDHPAVRGMVAAVSHLVRIVESAGREAGKP